MMPFGCAQLVPVRRMHAVTRVDFSRGLHRGAPPPAGCGTLPAGAPTEGYFASGGVSATGGGRSRRPPRGEVATGAGGEAARRGRRITALDVLPHVPGHGDHGVPVERGEPSSTRSRSRGTRSRRRRSSTTGQAHTVTVDEIERIVI